MLSISRNVRLSVCLSVRLCVCLFTFEVPFNVLFAPTSRNRMSNIFRDSESLGKSNGKKWSNIRTFSFGSGLKTPRKKKFFFLLILPWSILLWHRCYYPHQSRDALSPVCGIFFLLNPFLKQYSAAAMTGKFIPFTKAFSFLLHCTALIVAVLHKKVKLKSRQEESG